MFGRTLGPLGCSRVILTPYSDVRDYVSYYSTSVLHFCRYFIYLYDIRTCASEKVNTLLFNVEIND